MTLYDLTAEFQSLLATLEDTDGEPPPEVLADLERLEADIRTKGDGYCSLIRHYEAWRDACQEEACRIALRANTFADRAKWLKQRLHDALLRMGETKLSTAHNTVTVCRNGGVEPIEINVTPDCLPPEYRKERVLCDVNTDAIRDALTTGLDVPGCRLLPRGTHLRMR